VGSAACVYTGQPFDTLKVRMQVQVTGSEGAVACLKRSITNEGMLALWKGSVPAVTGAVAENVMAFSTNAALKKLLEPICGHGVKEGEVRIKGPLITGALTGALTAVVLTPCDILKCRAQVAIANGHALPTTTQLASHLFQTRGLRGFYTGFGAQVLREVPFFSAFFGSYEILCQSFKKYTQFNDATVYFVSGG
jgi:hypothetical protein